MNSLVAGAVAGFVATLPMTAAMKAMHELLPEEESYPLPPRLIVENAADMAGVEEHLDEQDQYHMTLAAHFGYGTATGAVYNTAVKASGAEPGVASGVAYGLGVWAASYLGLLPAAGLLSPATKHPARRNALMIASHIVWGAALGFTAGKLNDPRR